jgi:hypothetical protein
MAAEGPLPPLPPPQGYEVLNFPPAQQAYLSKHNQPTTYLAPKATTPYDVHDANSTAMATAPLQIEGMGYFKGIAAMQTIILLGMFGCLIAITARFYPQV